MYELSIVIPARNEEFLSRTIEDIIENKNDVTEVIAVLDGKWANPPIPQHKDVQVLYLPESVGQRKATNLGVKLSRAKYIMKVDAHCAFDKDFDIKMLADMEDDMTMIPAMRNLHAFDWQCNKCKARWYQGGKPDKCNVAECDSDSFERIMVWQFRRGVLSDFYRFDKTLHFQYWRDFRKRPESQGEIAETLSIQGSCFLCTRERYDYLDLCSESFNSWGQQGVEVACKTWLSGGRVLVNKKTWYAHLFRTQKGFRFPYPQDEKKVEANRELSRKLFFENQWDKAIHPFTWLIDKFSPVPEFDDEFMKYLHSFDSKIKT